MLEFPEDILQGANLIKTAVGAEKIVIGIEDNKKEAFSAIQNRIKEDVWEASLLKTKYPQGAEKNLIFALLNREVPSGGLPFDVGVVVQNVATVKAVWDAIAENKPLIERVITVSGPGIKNPKNLNVRIGTLFQDVIDFCGGPKKENNLLIMGGPMMGLAQWTSFVPVIKGTSGILLWEETSFPQEHACIGCARCVQSCPMSLVPTRLMKFSRFDHWEEAESGGILNCVECGCCQYSCPAHIPLVHWIRLGKNQIIKRKRKKNA
jgi:electron transport complex protein RnfC